MFKTETVVKGIGFLTLLVFCGITAQSQPAATPSPSTPPAFGSRTPWDSFCEEASILALPTDQQTPRRNQCNEGFSKYVEGLNANSNPCRNAVEDYNKAKGEAAQCEVFRQGGAMGCADSVEQCACLDMSAADKAKRPICGDVPSSSRSRGASSNIAELGRRYKACPEEAALDMEKLENEEKDLKKSVRELEKALAEKRKSHKADNKAGREKDNQIRKEKAEQTKALGEKFKQAKAKLRQARGELKKQVFELTEELTRISEKEEQVAARRREADLKYAEAKANITDNCYAKAMEDTSKQQQIEAAKLATNTRNLGGFAAIMKQVNRPERQQWKEVANYHFNQCMIDSMTKRRLKLALQMRDKQLKDAEGEERKLEEDRRNVKRRINALRNNKACSNADGTTHNGDTSETAMCEARLDALEDIDKANTDYAIDMNRLNRDADQNAKDQMEDMMEQQGEDTMSAMRDLADEKARLADLQALLAKKKEYASGRKTDQKAFHADGARISRLKQAAAMFVGCELKKPAPVGVNPPPPKCSGECLTAARYLYSVGIYGRSKLDAIGANTATGDEDYRNISDDAEATP